MQTVIKAVQLSLLSRLYFDKLWIKLPFQGPVMEIAV